MGFLRSLFGGSSSQAKIPATLPDVSEAQVLTRESNTPPERLAHAVGDVLNAIQKTFPLSDGIVAEVMVPSQDGKQLITEDIRPKEAPLLFARIRAGQSPCWQAFTTHQPQPYQKSSIGTAADSRSAPTRLVLSRSVLSIPVMRGDMALGVLNLESPSATALSLQTVTLLEQHGYLDALSKELTKIRTEPFSDANAAAFLIEKMEDRIAYTISPDDMSEAYYQILSVSASVVKPTNVSAGLVLVYNRSQELSAQDEQGEQGARYAVRAARFGAFNSALEWELKDQSIARRVIANKKGEVILDAQSDPDYRDSGTKQDRTGELSAPLVASGDKRATGVICLVTPQADNFDGDLDLGRMEKVAAIAVYAIHRSEEYKLGKRRSEQQRCANQLQSLLARLFPADMRDVTGALLKQVRKEVGDQILRWALSNTNSQHGAFVLIQATPEPDSSITNELVMTDQQTNGRTNDNEFAPGKLPRWAPDKGYTGQAFQRKGTLNITDVYSGNGADVKPDHYIPYFLNAKSEVATPLIIGDTVLGVLDVEADEANHFTSDYVDWIEFLAQQAAFALSVIDRASKTRVELAMADLSRQVDEAITTMRYQTLSSISKSPVERVEIIQKVRKDTLDLIIGRMRELVDAWVGRFLIELNSYTSKETIDEERGRLYYMASSDLNETSNQNQRFFRFDKGVSAVAFKSAQRIVFNTEEKRHEQYFDSDPTRKSLSGIFQPVFEGTHVTGVLNLECEQEGAFSPELIQAFEFAGNLISKLLTGSRLRIDTILREMLREFDFGIMRMQSSDLLTFADSALKSAAQLSIVNEHAGWGAIMQLHSSSDDSTPGIERLFWHDFTDAHSDTIMQESPHSSLEYPIFLETINTQRPVVILDRYEQPAEERRAELWPLEARSIIAVPLLGPKPVGEGYDVIGILALAQPDPAQYSDHDKLSLTLFAESIVYGFKTIALMQARAQLVRQLRSNINKAITPSFHYADTASDVLEQAEKAQTIQQALPQIKVARDAIPQFTQLLQLTGNLTGWFLDLSDDELLPRDDDNTPETAQGILAELREPANGFASVFDKTIQWDVPPTEELKLRSGTAVARLINAALFQYLDTAFRLGAGNSVVVGVQTSGGNVAFSVRFGGALIAQSRDDLTLSLNVVAGTKQSARQAASRIQQGLYQVAQVAQKLHGQAYYQPDNQLQLPNCFYLEVPLLS